MGEARRSGADPPATAPGRGNQAARYCSIRAREMSLSTEMRGVDRLARRGGGDGGSVAFASSMKVSSRRGCCRESQPNWPTPSRTAALAVHRPGQHRDVLLPSQ